MVKLYSEPFDNRVQDTIQLKEEYSNAIAETFAPAMAEKAAVALMVDLYHFYVYHRRKSGRRCSCWDIETSPDGLCQICWGTGCVGGFEKRGYRSETVDVTSPNLVMVNTFPAFDLQERPVPFSLLPSATKGYFEVEVSPLQNLGVLDHLEFVRSIPNGTMVKSYVKARTETSFVELTRASLQERLLVKSLVFRVELSRQSPMAPLPTASHIMFRYQTMETPYVRGDIPKRSESILLSELGITDNFASINVVFDSTLPVLGTEDFIVLLDETLHERNRFKLIEVNKFKPFETLVGWEVQARFVHDFENYKLFPF